MLAGRKVLVMDDDPRNIFALTSVLEQRELKVLHAENGTRRESNCLRPSRTWTLC